MRISALRIEGTLGRGLSISPGCRRKQEDGMRKFLLASVAALGTGGLIGTAVAQTPVVGAPTQGQTAYPLANPNASANNNNNYQAPQLPGVVANPTPGTIVIHMNARVLTQLQANWGSADKRTFTTPAGSTGGAAIAAGAATPAGTILGNNGTGTAKVAPYALDNYVRLYMGADAMAANGLRYGAGLEIRENFIGQRGNNADLGGSGYTCAQTLYVRRAFTYVAGDRWGIIRAGETDGIIGIFDNGVTTNQFLANNFNGGDQQNVPGSSVPWFFASGAGAEYGNTKVVYLSPQMAGVDFGFQWAPNASNGYGISGGNPINGSIISSGNGTGLSCGSFASSGCPTLTSGPGILDGSKPVNQTGLGVRYQGRFGDLGLLAYGMWEISGHANYTGLTTGLGTAGGSAILGTNVAGVTASKFNGKYDGFNFGNGGIALTYAGFTLGANAIGGRLNGQLALAPQGAVPEVAYTIGLKYVAGPLTMGVAGEIGWYQGDVRLTGLTQRRGRGINVGVDYTVAPGFLVFADYMYQEVHQGGFDFVTQAIGTSANNTYHSQGIILGNQISF